MSIRDRLVSIDTEYHTTPQGAIDRVYCLCATNADGVVYKHWFEGTDSGALENVKAFYHIDDPIFVCHSYELAERRALKWLGVNPLRYSFVCTWHIASQLTHDFRKPMKVKADNEEEGVEAAQAEKRKKESALSYASLCAHYGLGLVDTIHKEAMRMLCINGEVSGHEEEILQYCADDTQFLIPLLSRLFSQYYDALYKAFCPLRPGLFDHVTKEEAFMRLVAQTEHITRFGDIADWGIPVSVERIRKVQEHAVAYRAKLERSFAERYPGTYTQGADGLHRCSAGIQQYLRESLQALGITSYPVTKKGALATDRETLKDFFKGRECFGEDLRILLKAVNALRMVANPDKNPLNYVVDGRFQYSSLRPYGTKTSRCAPSTSRFLFGWSKFLYCVIEPPPGRWLVELDFSSEETFIQCCICRDAVYHDIYEGKDIYLGFAVKMGLVPKADFDTLTVDELKSRYHDVRKRVKSLVLGLSYGMGKSKLAASLGISEVAADRYVTSFRSVVYASTRYKDVLMSRLERCSAFALPDGFVCRSMHDKRSNNATTVGNWPFQSAGGQILRSLVKELYNEIEQGLPVRLIATIHDALFFEVSEGDTATIERVSETMRTIANRVLAAPDGWTIRVGEPEIIRHGELWTPEHAYDDEARELLNYEAD